MTTVLIVFLLACAASVVGTRLVMRLAWHFGVVDRPDGVRRLHARPTPRLGGVAIYAAFVLPLALLFCAGRWTLMAGVLHEHLRQFAGLLAGASCALLLGVVDDVLNLRAGWKLVWQIVIGTLATAAGFGIHVLSVPFGGAVSLGPLAHPVTVLWFVACMNAINFLDGLDGLATGASLFVGLTLFLVCLHGGNWLGLVLMAAFSGAALGFLFFNFPPARIFLGDSGSMLLGFLVAAISLLGATMKAEAAVALLVPVVALGLPVFDTSLAILRRWYHRVPLATPDRGHVHHVLVSMGYSPRRAVLALYGVCIVLGLAALLITVGRNEVVMLVTGALAITAFMSIRLFSGMTPAKVAARVLDDQRRRGDLSRAWAIVDRATRRMAAAGDADGVWRACRDALAESGLGCCGVTLRLAEGGREFAWAPGAAPAAPGRRDRLTLRMVLASSGRDVGLLCVEDCGIDAAATPEIIGLLVRLRDGLAEHLERIAASERSAES